MSAGKVITIKARRRYDGCRVQRQRIGAEDMGHPADREHRQHLGGGDIFQHSVTLGEENASDAVEIGEIAYWPPGSALLHIFSALRRRAAARRYARRAP